MTIAMTVYLVITNLAGKTTELRAATAVKVESSYLDLTDRCTITLPKKLVSKNGQSVYDSIKRGYGLRVFLGGNETANLEFEGYITSVGADAPIEIIAEDEMWKLKQVPVNISLQNTTLPALLRKIVPAQYEIDALPIELGSARFTSSTVAQVLETLKSDFELYSFFRGKVLHCGTIHQEQNTDLAFNKHVLNENLKYRTADEVAIKVRAISVLKGGDKIEVEVGEAGGEEHALTYYNITSKKDLTEMAQRDLEALQYDGFEGTVGIIGLKYVRHGEKVTLADPTNPDKDGTYYIERTVANWSDTGYERTLTIGKKA